MVHLGLISTTISWLKLGFQGFIWFIFSQYLVLFWSIFNAFKAHIQVLLHNISKKVWKWPEKWPEKSLKTAWRCVPASVPISTLLVHFWSILVNFQCILKPIFQVFYASKYLKNSLKMAWKWPENSMKMCACFCSYFCFI